jgi:hypothetical protein
MRERLLLIYFSSPLLHKACPASSREHCLTHYGLANPFFAPLYLTSILPFQKKIQNTNTIHEKYKSDEAELVYNTCISFIMTILFSINHHRQIIAFVSQCLI